MPCRFCGQGLEAKKDVESSICPKCNSKFARICNQYSITLSAALETSGWIVEPYEFDEDEHNFTKEAKGYVPFALGIRKGNVLIITYIDRSALWAVSSRLISDSIIARNLSSPLKRKSRRKFGS
ncbi:unnamed protein product [Phytomonas sp. Hart1]|nr:unnamed protein product [Phytomonas sp. Hart1]|eukprot:CCW70391.1 unnamed protein product [Phytomonas sp. isolate Hart1]